MDCACALRLAPTISSPMLALFIQRLINVRNRLSLWDPAATRERRLAFFDADAIFVRSGEALVDPAAVRAPSALPGDKHCGDAHHSLEYPGITREPRGGIVIRGKRIAKGDYYFNSGVCLQVQYATALWDHTYTLVVRPALQVMVFEPSREVHTELLATCVSSPLAPRRPVPHTPSQSQPCLFAPQHTFLCQVP